MAKAIPKLRLLLHAQGVTTTEFARSIGEDRNTVHNWFARGLPPAKLFVAAAALKMTPDELRPYLSTQDRLDPQQMLEMEVEAFLARLPHLAKDQRLYVLGRLFSILEEGERD